MSTDLEQKRGIACPKCGQSNPDGWLVCRGCHTPLRRQLTETSGGSNSIQARDHHKAPTTHPLALLSLACGVVAIFAPAGLVAIVSGHIAQIQISRDPEKYRGRNVAKLALVLGYIGVLIFSTLVFGIKNAGHLWRTTTVAAPSPGAEKNDPYYRAIRNRPVMSLAERENKGVILIKALHQAEANYKSSHPTEGYTCVLENLFQSGFDESVLQLSIDTGYTLSITDCTANPKGVRESYRAFAAAPTGGNGISICADQSGIVRTSNAATNGACFDSGKPIAIQ